MDYRCTNCQHSENHRIQVMLVNSNLILQLGERDREIARLRAQLEQAVPVRRQREETPDPVELYEVYQADPTTQKETFTVDGKEYSIEELSQTKIFGLSRLQRYRFCRSDGNCRYGINCGFAHLKSKHP